MKIMNETECTILMGFSFIFNDILFVFNNLEFKNNFALNVVVKILPKIFFRKN